MAQRKPTEAKILEGTFRRDKDGDPGRAVLARGEPVPPAGLAGKALEFWGEVVPGLVGLGVVGRTDSAALGMMCVWWARHEKAGKALDRARAGGKGHHSLLVQAAICFDKFDRLAARFGMTPCDRAKLRLQPAQSLAGSHLPDGAVPVRDRSGAG